MTKPLRNPRVTIHWKKMSCTNNRFGTDDFKQGIPIPSSFKTNSPHACIFIPFIRFMNVPMYQGAEMSFLAIEKREKKVNLGNDHAQKSLLSLIQFNKDSIISSPTTKTWCCSNSLTMEPSSPTEITWCIEGSQCRVMDLDQIFKFLADKVGRQIFVIWVVEEV